MLSIGIVGLPNVGKSTLFKALTKKQIDIQNYPFTTIDPAVGVVKVPDERLDKLNTMSKSKRLVPAIIDFIDIAGLVKGAAQGEGLGNQFLANIREANAIAHVVRVFNDDNVIHVHNAVDPINDIEVINAELLFADLATVEKRIEKTKKNDPKTKEDFEILEKIKQSLNSGILVSQIKSDEKEQKLVDELYLLTKKPVIYVFNLSEQQLVADWQPSKELLTIIGNNSYVRICNNIELMLSESTDEEKQLILSDLKLSRSGLDELIQKSYSLLKLVSFFTTGEDETRAWTIQEGTPIAKAAAVIHTDFEKLFIRADVINWQELLNIGSWSQAKALGKIHVAGREYIVKDGDVLEIKI